ncbi:MAG TPA: hypothetical protein VFT75_07275 [Nocardioidaceae bacterium]|nr:hypothetical protein [Nocardioidaceae bacterium]
MTASTALCRRTASRIANTRAATLAWESSTPTTITLERSCVIVSTS